jgi:hypothetical protein
VAAPAVPPVTLPALMVVWVWFFALTELPLKVMTSGVVVSGPPVMAMSALVHPTMLAAVAATLIAVRIVVAFASYAIAAVVNVSPLFRVKVSVNVPAEGEPAEDGDVLDFVHGVIAGRIVEVAVLSAGCR